MKKQITLALKATFALMAICLSSCIETDSPTLFGRFQTDVSLCDPEQVVKRLSFNDGLYDVFVDYTNEESLFIGSYVPINHGGIFFTSDSPELEEKYGTNRMKVGELRISKSEGTTYNDFFQKKTRKLDIELCTKVNESVPYLNLKTEIEPGKFSYLMLEASNRVWFIQDANGKETVAAIRNHAKVAGFENLIPIDKADEKDLNTFSMEALTFGLNMMSVSKKDLELPDKGTRSSDFTADKSDARIVHLLVPSDAHRKALWNAANGQITQEIMVIPAK